MGILKDGIFGPISGHVKNMVFYTVNGVNIIRSKAEIKKDYTPSPAQKASNSRFALLSGFLKKVKPFIKIGFGAQSAGTNNSYHNLAASYNMRHAIHQGPDTAEIRFDQLRLSEGVLMIAEEPHANLSPEGLIFSWSTDNLRYAASQNRAMLLIYMPDIQEVIMNIDGTKRVAGTDILKLEDSYKNQRMEVFLAFRAIDSAEVSTSQYLGRIN